MAMKIIHQDMMASSQLVGRFIEEAQVEAQLQHPNIVPIYEIGQLPDGRHYFTMKEIRGRGFSTQIQSVHAASPSDRWGASADGTSFRDLVRIHQQVCETIAYTHAQRVIHRDLKPENVMLTPAGEVKILDFGLARVDDLAGRRDRSVKGTLLYMAPEQATGRFVSHRSDLFAVGL